MRKRKHHPSKREAIQAALGQLGWHASGEEEVEFDAEEVEDMRREDIRQCTRDLLLIERAREWLLEDSE